MAGSNALRLAIERAWWSPRPGWWAILASPLSVLYGVLLHLRRWAYRQGLFKTGKAPVPVVVVGNLIVGGAGKSPCVIALVAALRSAGWRPGVISRGHGASQSQPRSVQALSHAAEVGDEPLLLSRRTGVPVWVGHDRLRTALALCQAHPEVNVLVSDDGLQHLALHRDVQVVVFDARGLGNGKLLPAGPLREPAWTAPPANTFIVYNCARASTPLQGLPAQGRIGSFLPLRDWWAGHTDTALTAAQISSQPILAAAGMGQPERFFGMLEEMGLQIQRCPLPDHASLTPRPWPPGTPLIVVTEKDAVKLLPASPDAHTIVVATLDFDLPDAVFRQVETVLSHPTS